MLSLSLVVLVLFASGEAWAASHIWNNGMPPVGVADGDTVTISGTPSGTLDLAGLLAGETVTIDGLVGTPIAPLTNNLSFNIPADVTVVWEAELTGNTPANPLIQVAGGGVFAIADGKIEQLSGAPNHMTAISAPNVIVSGGEVSANTGIAISASNVIVSSGKVAAIGSNATIAAPAGTVTISGGEVTGAALAIQSDNVTVSGGTVIATGVGGMVIDIGIGNGSATISGGNVRATGENGTAIIGPGENTTIEVTGGTVRAGERGTFVIAVPPLTLGVTGRAIFANGHVTVSGGDVLAEGRESTAIGATMPTIAPFDNGSSSRIMVTGGTVACIAGVIPLLGTASCTGISTNGVAAFLDETLRGSLHSGGYFGVIVEVDRLGVPVSFGGTTDGLTMYSSGNAEWDAPLAAVGNPAIINTERTFGATTMVRSIPWGTVVGDAPKIISADNAAVTFGTGGTFQVTTTGVTPMDYQLSGEPAGVNINAATGLITIAATTVVGTHTFDITASNGVNPDDTQNFTLTVNAVLIAGAGIDVAEPVTGDAQDPDASGDCDVAAGVNFTCSTITWSPNDDPFEIGKQYTATVILDANAGFAFDAAFTATINGQAATVTNNNGDTVTLSYQFSPTVAVVIANANIDVTAPVTGDPQDTAADGDCNAAAGANFTCSTVTWSPNDNPFEGDKQYTATMTLTAANTHTFTGLANATINGQNAMVINNNGNTVTLSYQFAATDLWSVSYRFPGHPVRNFHDFGQVFVGYGAVTAQDVEVENTGNQPTGALTVTLGGVNAGSFAILNNNIPAAGLAVGANSSFQIVPNHGLGVGAYAATVTIAGANGISSSFSVAFAVTATPFSATASIPMLNPVALVLLALALGGMAFWRRRRV
jgi:hypothetical protein